MPDKPMLILSNPPAFTIAGSGDEYGTVDLTTLHTAISLAHNAHKTADQAASEPDSVESLREAVNTLSDAITALAGEIYQIGVGVRTGRIAVMGPEF